MKTQTGARHVDAVTLVADADQTCTFTERGSSSRSLPRGAVGSSSCLK